MRCIAEDFDEVKWLALLKSFPCYDNYEWRDDVRHDQRNRGKNSSVKSRGWINKYPHANNTTRSSASRGIDLYYSHEHPRHDPFRRLFCHYRGGIFIQGGGKILPVSHQEGTILPLNSSGETIIYFILDLTREYLCESFTQNVLGSVIRTRTLKHSNPPTLRHSNSNDAPTQMFQGSILWVRKFWLFFEISCKFEFWPITVQERKSSKN